MTSSFWEVLTRSQFNGLGRRPAGGIFAVDGTTYPGAPAPPFPIRNDGQGYWCGFSSGLVGGLMNLVDGLWDSFCIGYSAATVPMWPSVQEARQNLKVAIKAYAAAYLAQWGVYPAIIGTGYSQGSMAWDQLWALDILPEDGELHYLLPYIYRIYQFGHIFRTPGIAHGNALAGLPESIIQDGVETGGIGLALDLTVEQTNYPAPDGKPVVYSCANKGDLYSANSCGLNPWTAPAPEGKVGNIFMAIIMQPTFLDVVKTVEVLGEPLKAVLELFHTMSFFAQGMNSPHYQYFPQMNACIDDAVALGLSLPHELGI
jgi:hypothetical protein